MTGNQVDKVKEDEPASSAVSEQSAAIGEDDDDLMYSDGETVVSFLTFFH
jgi:hypothetical protein